MLSMLGALKNGVEASQRPVVWLHAAENGRQHASGLRLKEFPNKTLGSL